MLPNTISAPRKSLRFDNYCEYQEIKPTTAIAYTHWQMENKTSLRSAKHLDKQYGFWNVRVNKQWMKPVNTQYPKTLGEIENDPGSMPCVGKMKIT